jgi:hypothetical protein
MTIVVVALLGLGILLIASALDDCAIIPTFQKVVSGNSVNWKGNKTNCGTTSPSSTSPTSPINSILPTLTGCGAIPTKPVDSKGNCPCGYTLKDQWPNTNGSICVARGTHVECGNAGFDARGDVANALCASLKIGCC